VANWLSSIPNTKAPRAAAVVNYKKNRYESLQVQTVGPNFPQSALWADGLEVDGKLYE
jgi:hypothetical protein